MPSSLLEVHVLVKRAPVSDVHQLKSPTDRQDRYVSLAGRRVKGELPLVSIDFEGAEFLVRRGTVMRGIDVRSPT
jgi:hypothetical protein